MSSTIDTVLQDEELILRWLPGSTRRMVVVFTGLKAGFGGAPLDEFAGSASDKGKNNVLFVTDRRATWFAAPGLWRRIVKLIRYLRKSERIDEIVTLGNSMGGFGALLLPRDVRVRRAIAFSPQLTMDRTLMDDTRWPDIKDKFGDLPVDNVGGCREDVAHLDFAPEMNRVHRFVLPKGRHNIAGALKDAGLLSDVIGAIIRGRKTRVERLYAEYAEGVA